MDSLQIPVFCSFRGGAQQEVPGSVSGDWYSRKHGKLLKEQENFFRTGVGQDGQHHTTRYGSKHGLADTRKVKNE